MQHMSTSVLVGTALSVALAPRQGAASVGQGADLLKAFPGATFTNWTSNTDPCGETHTWEGITCKAGKVFSVSLEANGTTLFGFGPLPTTVQEFVLQGPGFTWNPDDYGCFGVGNFTKLTLINTVNFVVNCWDSIPLGRLTSLILRKPNPGPEKYDWLVESWQFFEVIQDLVLNDLDLYNTIPLSKLPPSIKHVDVSSNKFNSVDWEVDASSNLSTFLASNNEISQVSTDKLLPRGLKVLSLQNNPHAVGSLNITSLPEAFRHMNATVFSDSVRLHNTQLCFTGTDEDFEGPAGAPFLPRQCSIDQGRGLCATFPEAFPSWTADTDPCALGGPWKGITCGVSDRCSADSCPKDLERVLQVEVESHGKSPPILVRFKTLPSTVEKLTITGTSFKLVDCKGLHDVLNLHDVELVSMTTPEVLCDWDDFPVHAPAGVGGTGRDDYYFVIEGQSVRFSSSVVPWSKFARFEELRLVDMELTGTVDIESLCQVNEVDLPGNNFTHINWAPNCSCNASTEFLDCMYYLDVSKNAIDQTITAGDLPPHVDGEGWGYLLLNNNPMLKGALDATAMPSGVLTVINNINNLTVSDYVDVQNTGLCFTGMHTASANSTLTRAQVDWFAARSCPAPVSPTAAPTASAHTATIIAGSVVGSVALLALIGAGVVYGIMRKKRAALRGSVTTEEEEESPTAEYEMKPSVN